MSLLEFNESEMWNDFLLLQDLKKGLVYEQHTIDEQNKILFPEDDDSM